MKMKMTKIVKQSEVLSFLRRNPNPPDKKVHDWAVRNGYDVDKVEQAIYKLATKYARGKK